MLRLILLLIYFNSFQLLAAERIELVVENQNGIYSEKVEVTLQDLDSPTLYSNNTLGIYYKDSPVEKNIKTDNLIKKKAANLYYHLHKSQHFFKEFVQAPIFRKLKINANILLDDDVEDPILFNTVNSTLAEDPNTIIINFYPGKILDQNEIASNYIDQNTEYIESLENIGESLIREAFLRAESIKTTDYLLYVLDIAWLFGKTKILPALNNTYYKIAHGKFYADTAMVPEIIYQEMSKIALSSIDDFENRQDEFKGIIEYFTAKIINRPVLGKDVGSNTQGTFKFDGTKKFKYHQAIEYNKYIKDQFIFGFLWKLDQNLNDRNSIKMLYKSFKSLPVNFSIHDLLMTLRRTFRNEIDDNKLRRIYEMKLIQTALSVGL